MYKDADCTGDDNTCTNKSVVKSMNVQKIMIVQVMIINVMSINQVLEPVL